MYVAISVTCETGCTEGGYPSTTDMVTIDYFAAAADLRQPIGTMITRKSTFYDIVRFCEYTGLAPSSR